MKVSIFAGVAVLLCALMSAPAQAQAPAQVDTESLLAKAYGPSAILAEPAIPPEKTGRVDMTIQLLTAEQDLAQRTTAGSLALFIENVRAAAKRTLVRQAGSAHVLTEFRCTPKLCQLRMASDGNVEREVLKTLYDQLRTLAPVQASGPVAFALEFTLTP